MLSGKVVVVGGDNSANTTRLAGFCREQGTQAYHVETAGEIAPLWFKDVRRVGLIADASTPQLLIDEIMANLGRF